MRARTRSRRRLPLTLVGLLAVGVLLAACTPEPPPPPPPPPPTAAPAHPECGSVEPAADGTALTVESADGTRKVVSVPDGRNVEDEVQSAQRAGKKVLEVEPEVPVTAAVVDGDIDDPYFNAATPPNAPAYGLWGLKRIDAPQAWGTGSAAQGSGVTVAVIDTGVQADHPGFAGRVLPGKDFVVDLPFDGRVDGNGHGTHVAGTIAENDDTAAGIGVAPDVQILPVRVLGCSGGGSSTAVANGIYWAISHGADVINLSLGTGSPSTTILLAVEEALRQNVVVAAAAGNSGTEATCPTPTTTTSTIPPTSAPTLPPSTGTSGTTTPIGTQAAGSVTSVAPPTTTSTSSSTATSTTSAPPASEPAAPEATEALDAVTVLACSGTPPMTPALYPAAYAIGRPGLLAVAATGSLVNVQFSGSGSGVLHWLKAAGDYIDPTTPVLTINNVPKTIPLHGVLVDLKLEGQTVVAGSQIATVLSADSRAPYSNVNSYVTVAAPGGGVPSTSYGVWSTVPGGYGFKSGTSMATPHIAAVAALVLAKCDTLTAAQVMNAITSTAENLGPAGWDPVFGAGMVQADGAVAATTAC